MATIGLGTAGFGSEYGIANNKNPPRKEAYDILEYALKSGITVLDTASDYLHSEKRIGKFKDHDKFKIITKGNKWTIDMSLENLQSSSCYGFLFHEPLDLLEPNLWVEDFLKRAKTQELVSKIGFSVYDPVEIDCILGRYPGAFNIIQLPVSILDQRFIHSGSLKKLKDLGFEIHARSCFLQGLLLMDRGKIPKQFKNYIPHLKKFETMANLIGISKLELALQFVKNIPEVDVVVCGVNSVEHLKEIVLAKQKGWDCLEVTDRRLTDPRLWEKT